ncbi:MAG TPA: hypothetical protein VIH18_32900 [Candidatus Binatia bacterium]|jgi:hypothetical protein
MELERVRANTAIEINQKIDQKTEENIRYYSGRPTDEITRRIWELETEWDVERVLQAMASVFSLTGLTLGTTVARRWFILPSVVLSFLLLHAVQGWCPPLPVLRRLGFRTREEIDREKYELKAVIGGTNGLNENLRSPVPALTAVGR